MCTLKKKAQASHHSTLRLEQRKHNLGQVRPQESRGRVGVTPGGTPTAAPLGVPRALPGAPLAFLCLVLQTSVGGGRGLGEGEAPVRSGWGWLPSPTVHEELSAPPAGSDTAQSAPLEGPVAAVPAPAQTRGVSLRARAERIGQHPPPRRRREEGAGRRIHLAAPAPSPPLPPPPG